MSGSAQPVLIMAGGTGGHIFPGVAVADELRRRGIPVVWLGSQGGLETQIVPKAGIALETLDIGGVRGKGLMVKLTSVLRIIKAVLAARAILRRVDPRSVLSMGGFAAGPGGLAAWMLRRPLLVHEQNRVPGMTNRVLSRLARLTLSGFSDAFAQSGKLRWVGNPVRAAISALAPPQERLAQRTGSLRLLVLGGSLGAQALNTRLPQALAALDADICPQVRHQCGARHLDAAREAYAAAGVSAQVDSFIEDMAEAYAWADLVVCRAGALTLAEIAAAGVGSVLVPFPHAVDDHQTRNAESFVAAGAAVLLPESQASAQVLAGTLGDLLRSRQQLIAMAVAARSLAKPDAAATIADHCLEVAA
ncbi:undecaprenyldiphospho-muramoylpentapeptide beta-N-acetylglucosaminyltransferase [Tahibacter amnicola]|uniref:UDP-N-acetylglucosamine--N-acetylmuramyl-(pentapeptide) pyrophosphoryl-undecaprenol N-acetylglucosamine transferase n=1 Tax=Tahibacter amnicola TaxID=2976241 RepID=A0ABY6BF32_9GAMM|nr:undecaprenyldiphospho-muramoylpentapeptide beta-N-acetylglucosaminyltransferase [Tahibacter amnicola]UXI67715.1 undecaprenyldiphospho-muramoylpentapeptide beta-N-acetylglucosaminyltransferase [Tahibacter amnicola]